jgi:hypothetical protein
VCHINFLTVDAFFLCHFSSSRRPEFCSRIIRTTSVFNSRRVWTSSSAFRRSTALKWDIAVAFISSSSCVLYCDSLSGVRNVPSVSAKIRTFLGFEVVKLVVIRDPYTGITTFTTVAVTGHRVLSHWNSVVLETTLFIAERWRLLYFPIEVMC